MKLIKEQIVFQGKFIEVVLHTLKAGKHELIFEIARRSPGIRLIICDKDKILITKEFRKELNAFDYRLPGGKVFDSLIDYNQHKKDIKKHVLYAAKKECIEETGLIPQSLSLYFISRAGATIEWDLYYYIVKKFKLHAKGQQLEVDEDIIVEWKNKKEILSLIKKGAMHEDRSVGVLLRYLS